MLDEFDSDESTVPKGVDSANTSATKEQKEQSKDNTHSRNHTKQGVSYSNGSRGQKTSWSRDGYVENQSSPTNGRRIDSTEPMTKESTFSDVYNNEARAVDRELVNDWNSSLNSLLLFAAIFAAVLTAFIIESKKLLEQDPGDATTAVITFFVNHYSNGTLGPYDPPPFHPDKWAISVNCLLFASLSASIFAALASVIALQWVAEYDAAISRAGSSPIERMKHRQLRFGGVEYWKMGELIASLPLLLYLSVLLFFAGLSQWMIKIHPAVGYIVLGGGALSAVFYFSTSIITVLSSSSPFRTPLARWISAILHLPFSILHRLLLTMSGKRSTKFDSLRISKRTIQKRDNRKMESDPDLVPVGLKWLTNRISISPDSHHRLMLLLDGMSTLDQPRLELALPKAVAWDRVFEVLGSYYFSIPGGRMFTDTDLNGLQILFQCHQNPAIHSLFRPLSCLISSDPLQLDTEKGITDTPNATELLFQFIPPVALQSLDSAIMFRLAQWYYIRNNLGGSNWRFYWSKELQSAQDYQSLHGSLLRSAFARLKGASIDTAQSAMDDLTGLISIIPIEGSTSQPLPLSYHPTAFRIQSRRFIKYGCIKEASKYISIHDLLQHLLKIRKRYPSLDPLWHLNITLDDFEPMTRVYSHRSEDLSIERFPSVQMWDGVIDYLQTFDQFIQDGCSDEQKSLMMDLFIAEMENRPITSSNIGAIPERDSRITELRDPCIRLLACAVTGISWDDSWTASIDVESWSEGQREAWRKASDFCCRDSPSIKKPYIEDLRTRLWYYLDPESVGEILLPALRDTKAFAELRRWLADKESSTKEREDLLLIRVHVALVRWTSRMMTKSDAQLSEQYRRDPPVVLLHFLYDPGQGPRSFKIGSSFIQEAILTRFAYILKDIREDQTRLFNLLVTILQHGLLLPNAIEAIFKAIEGSINPKPPAGRRAVNSAYSETISNNPNLKITAPSSLRHELIRLLEEVELGNAKEEISQYEDIKRALVAT